MILREKYVRLENEDKRRQLMEREVPKRLKTRSGWREETKAAAGETINRTFERPTILPMTPLNLEITEVTLRKKKEEYSKEELREITEVKIAEIDADTELYTDGSTGGDQKNGGAGIFAQDKNGNTLLERSS